LHATCALSGEGDSLSPFAEALSDHLSTLTHEQREAVWRANPWLTRIVPERALPGPPARALLDLVTAGYAAHIELESMSAQHAGDLVQRYLPDASELVTAQIVADAGGIPSLLVALAGESSADGLHSPSAIAFIIRSSVASLSPLARDLLSIAARRDPAMTRNDLPRPTAGRKTHQHRALDELCEAGLVVTSGDGRCDIAAPAIRTAVITLLPGP
jgi:hypothetical protein